MFTQARCPALLEIPRSICHCGDTVTLTHDQDGKKLMDGVTN
jgi:hypothetical protein